MSQRTELITDLAVFELLTLGTLLLVAVMGAIITYQAYRGYRRNNVQSMLYLAVGLFLLTVCPFVINITVSTIVGPGQIVILFFENVSRLLGLVAIMYSLYGQH